MLWIELLTEPLVYEFMIRSLLAAVMVGILGPVLGSYMILQGTIFLGESLSHIILPGVVLAYLFGWPLAVGALVVGVLAAISINALSAGSQIRQDTAIGVILAGSFALGIAMLSTTRSYAVDLSHILFGNILGISTADLWLTFGLGLLVLLTVFLFYKEFLVLAFDPNLAVVLRLPQSFLRYLFSILIAVTIVTSLQTVGVTLVLAMLVTPAATAQLLTRRLPTMMLVASGIGIVSNVSGLYISYFMDVASGPAMVLIATGIFGIVFLAAPGRGLLWQQHSKSKPILFKSDASGSTDTE